jgi:hypothetical protein
VLDGGGLDGAHRDSRLAAFASPSLRPPAPARLDTPLPVPVIADATQTPAATQDPETPAVRPRGVMVPPLARRAPETPVLAMDSLAAPPAPPPAGAAKLAVAPEVTLGTEFRSALGGPPTQAAASAGFAPAQEQ